MIGNAFIIGFFTAMGWISAHKVMATVDVKTTTQIEQKQN